MSHLLECPYCGFMFENNAEYVNVGVGGPGIQLTGNACDRCHATERGAYKSQSEMDNVTGWFPPHFPSTVGPDTEWLDGLLERVFAMGVRRGMHLAPAPDGPPVDSLAPALAITMAPAPNLADVPF